MGLFKSTNSKLKKILEHGLKIYPDDLDGFEKYCVSKLNEEFGDEWFEKLKNESSDEIITIYHILYNIYLEKNDLQNAKKFINEVMNRDPSPELSMKLYDVLIKLEAWNELLEISKEMSKKNAISSLNPHLLFIALAHDNLYQPRLAYLYYFTALQVTMKKQEDYEGTHWGLEDQKKQNIDLLMDLKQRYPDIEFIPDIESLKFDHYDKALKIEPKDEEALINKGLGLDNADIHDESIESYDKELEIEPENVDALINKGRKLAGLERYEEAIECHDKALEIEPKNVRVLDWKGYALFMLKRYEEAIECHDKALEIEPKNVDALHGKGQSLDSLERYEEAIECYDKALEIEPENELILEDLSFTKSKMLNY